MTTAIYDNNERFIRQNTINDRNILKYLKKINIIK